MVIVKIADVPGFRKWLYGQTLPMVKGNKYPFGWAYYDDYVRFIEKLPVID